MSFLPPLGTSSRTFWQVYRILLNVKMFVNVSMNLGVFNVVAYSRQLNSDSMFHVDENLVTHCSCLNQVGIMKCLMNSDGLIRLALHTKLFRAIISSLEMNAAAHSNSPDLPLIHMC